MFLWDGQQAHIFSNSIRVVGKFIDNNIFSWRPRNILCSKKIVLIIRARGGSSKIYFFWAEKEFYLVRWNNHIFKISLINLQFTFFSFYSKDFDGFFFSHIIFSLHQRKFMKGKLVLISGWGIPHRPILNLPNIKRCFWHLKISITLLLFRY